MTPSRLPATKPDRVIAGLEACGLRIIRRRGSHAILSKPGLARPVVVARHREEIGPKLLAKILAQAEVTPEEFLKRV